jgi:hypothetical protein
MSMWSNTHHHLRVRCPSIEAGQTSSVRGASFPCLATTTTSSFQGTRRIRCLVHNHTVPCLLSLPALSADCGYAFFARAAGAVAAGCSSGMNRCTCAFCLLPSTAVAGAVLVSLCSRSPVAVLVRGDAVLVCLRPRVVLASRRGAAARRLRCPRPLSRRRGLTAGRRFMPRLAAWPVVALPLACQHSLTPPGLPWPRAAWPRAWPVSDRARGLVPLHHFPALG